MPIYEYSCKSCGYIFDVLQKMSAKPLADCPECGKPELKKLVSAPNFRLKGSGWYETDFKKDNRRNVVEGSEKKDAAGSKTDGEGKKAGAAGDKTETKTAGDRKSSGGKPASGRPADGKSGSI